MPLLMRAARRQGISGAMRNPYDIALKPAWTEWAAKQGVSETIAAAVYLLGENRKAEDVVGKLNRSELGESSTSSGTSRTAFPRGSSPPLRKADARRQRHRSDPAVLVPDATLMESNSMMTHSAGSPPRVCPSRS